MTIGALIAHIAFRQRSTSLVLSSTCVIAAVGLLSQMETWRHWILGPVFVGISVLGGLLAALSVRARTAV